MRDVRRDGLIEAFLIAFTPPRGLPYLRVYPRYSSTFPGPARWPYLANAASILLPLHHGSSPSFSFSSSRFGHSRLYFPPSSSLACNIMPLICTRRTLLAPSLCLSFFLSLTYTYTHHSTYMHTQTLGYTLVHIHTFSLPLCLLLSSPLRPK